MEIKEIEHLAELSKLEFTDDELQEFATQFESIVKLADVIKDADISGQRVVVAMPMEDLREDEHKASTPVDVLLQNSPIVKDDSIVVPRIME